MKVFIVALALLIGTPVSSYAQNVEPINAADWTTSTNTVVSDETVLIVEAPSDGYTVNVTAGNYSEKQSGQTTVFSFDRTTNVQVTMWVRLQNGTMRTGKFNVVVRKGLETTFKVNYRPTGGNAAGGANNSQAGYGANTNQANAAPTYYGNFENCSAKQQTIELLVDDRPVMNRFTINANQRKQMPLPRGNYTIRFFEQTPDGNVELRSTARNLIVNGDNWEYKHQCKAPAAYRNGNIWNCSVYDYKLTAKNANNQVVWSIEVPRGARMNSKMLAGDYTFTWIDPNNMVYTYGITKRFTVPEKDGWFLSSPKSASDGNPSCN